MRLALLPENHLGKRTLLQKWRRSVKESQICRIFFPLIRGEFEKLSLIPGRKINGCQILQEYQLCGNLTDLLFASAGIYVNRRVNKF